MTSYRFCRSDDIPLLVEAHNRCYRSTSGARDPLTVERFKQLIRELHLWTSSCMVAMAGDQPIAVVLAAKRETENWIYRVAVHPDHQRQGHGQHLLTSLSQKMAILGPPRLLAEVPESDSGLLPFFLACGYRREGGLTDFVATPLADAPEPPPILQRVRWSDVASLLRDGPERSWCRRLESLNTLADELEGYAVVSDQRIEALTLFRDAPRGGEREVRILGLHEGVEPELTAALLSMLLIQLRRTASGRVFVPRLEEQEIGFEHLSRCGFEPGERYARLAATAAPL